MQREDWIGERTGVPSLGRTLSDPLGQEPIHEVPRWVWGLVVLAGLVQFVILLMYAINKYHHFDLSEDYGIVNQVTYLIAHGHLDPFDTIYQDQFWRDQFSLIAWPVALLRLATGTGLSLLILQALALAGTTVVILGFGVAIVRRSRGAGLLRWSVFGVVGVLTLGDPWLYESASFDFHFQSIAALTLIVSVVALFGRRYRLGWVMVVLTVLCGTSEILLVIGVGLGFLILLPPLRRSGIVTLGIGLAWLLADFALGAHQSTTFASSYGYLASTVHPTLVKIAAAVVQHPGRPLHVLASRGSSIVSILGDSGLVGLLFPPAGLTALIAIVANGLQQSSGFLSISSGGFQNFPEVALLLLGTVAVGNWLVDVVVPWASRRALVRTALISVVVVVGVIAGLGEANFDRSIPPFWLTVPPGAASRLSAVHIPVGDEAIVSEGIVGRFTARREVFAIFGADQRFQVCSPTLFVVVGADNGFEVSPRVNSVRIIGDLDHDRDATLRVAGDQVAVFELTNQQLGAFLSFTRSNGVLTTVAPAFGDERCTDESGPGDAHSQGA